jgi:hypothetical protein
MPPNDDPFATPTPAPAAEPTPEPSPAPDPAQPAPADPGPGMAAQLEAATAPLKEAIASLNAQLAASEAARNKPEPTPEISSDEFSQAFYNDPQGTIRQEFNASSQPLVSTLADQIAEHNYESQRSRVDAEWGEGSFDKVIDAELRPIIEEAKQVNAEGLLNRQMFVNAVDTIIGRKAKDLVGYSKESQTAAETATLEQVQRLKETVLADVQPNLSGGIRHGGAPSQAVLSEDQQQYIKDMFKADGVQRDEKRLAAIQAAAPRTIEDYRRLNDSLKEQQ